MRRSSRAPLALIVLVLAAGCLEEPAPGGPGVAVTIPAPTDLLPTPPSLDLPPTPATVPVPTPATPTQAPPEPEPSRPEAFGPSVAEAEREGVRLRVSVTPREAGPGEQVMIVALLENLGGTPVEIQPFACGTDVLRFSTRDGTGRERSLEPSNPACPSRPPAVRLDPGERALRRQPYMGAEEGTGPREGVSVAPGAYEALVRAQVMEAEGSVRRSFSLEAAAGFAWRAAPVGADPDEAGLRMTLTASSDHLVANGSVRLVAHLRNEGNETLYVNGVCEPPFTLLAQGPEGGLFLHPQAGCGPWQPLAFPPGSEARRELAWNGTWYSYLSDDPHPRAGAGEYVVHASALFYRTPDQLDRPKHATASVPVRLD